MVPYQKIIACFLIAVGLGWVFAEVRRFFVDTGNFVMEAEDDQRRGWPASIVFGVAFLFVGAVLAFNGFGFGNVPIYFHSPFFDSAGPDLRRFLVIFISGTAAWGLFSAFSVQFLPPPLFDEVTTVRLTNWVRGILLVIWGAVLILGLWHGGQLWSAWGLGFLVAALVLLLIGTGSLWSNYVDGWWKIPAITCEERPFPYVASVLLCLAIEAFCFFGSLLTHAPTAIISAPR